jgi:regulator of nonsense transcripts 2
MENEAENNETPDETAQNTEENDKSYLYEYINNLENRIKQKTEMRQQNLNCVRPPENHFSKLDSGLKKNTTFVKKLKTFSATQMDALLKDFSSLNLTKYISEVAAAIAEAKLKMSDIPAAINLCSSLHRTYSDFSSNFFENWQKILTFKATDKIANSSKLRVDIRFYAELVTVGIFTNKTGLPLLGNVLTVLINMDKEEHNNIPILLSFCKHCGEDYAGLMPKKIRDSSEVSCMEVIL